MEPIDFRVWGAPEPWLKYGLCTHPVAVTPLTTEVRPSHFGLGPRAVCARGCVACALLPDCVPSL